MTRLILWRHGRTGWNLVGRVQGHLDVDLDDIGIAQARAAAPRVAAYEPDVIISSDLRRATRTAAALAGLTVTPVELDPRFRERHYGLWQGLTQADIRDGYPEDYLRWGTAEPVQEPSIETGPEMAKRVGAALRELTERIGPDGTAVIVTHGGTARVSCASLLGWPADQWHTLGSLANCHNAELRGIDNQGWQLRAHNVP